MSADILDRLHAALPDAAFREAGPAYLEEPRGRWHGQAAAVVAPGSTDEVAAILRVCAATGTPVIPFGGGTGLVGGQLDGSGAAPVVLSLERMDKIRAVDTDGPSIEVEAGAILQSLQEAASREGLVFPLTLASQGSARIGGLLATNAGGVHVLRYGNARDLCLGIEAVMADGSVYHGLSALRKNNTGYDLRHLLIGSEGTLGVITAATLRLFPAPKSEAAAFFAVRDPAAALDLLRLAHETAGPALSAFELISRTGFDFMDEVGINLRAPFSEMPDWMCLVETGSSGDDAGDILEALFSQAFEEDIASDGVVSRSEGQRAAFWEMRERIPEANRKIGAVSSHDISVPVARIPDFIAEAPGRIAAIDAFRINCFGHMGDGNLHYNVFPVPGKSRKDHEDQRDAIKRAVHDLVHEMGGSVSAEHGIGRLKVGDLERYGDPAKLAAMRAIKAALDPQNILNPGAVLRKG
ncbi:FAD-binding protein [Rhodobacterales bacterium HKCCE3408]|nr:FAD-binding protein [Rhodobacterales bacterium HKCCE3408]